MQRYDPSTLDSYLLHLFLYTVFNGPLPNSFLSPSSPSETPALPQTRGSFPPALFQPWRRLGNPNPAARLKTTAFLDLGQHPGAEGWWPSNRLVKLSAALDGFALATEDERTLLIRTLKAIAAGAANSKTPPLPNGFLKYKVLPSLVHTFEFSSGSGGAPLLPVILDLASDSSSSSHQNGGGGGGDGIGDDEKEYQREIVQPIVRMYATPDRAIRMALLENLERYADRLTNKDVNEKIWPHLQTGFGDVVPVIREATVKAIPLIAPKVSSRKGQNGSGPDSRGTDQPARVQLNDRILNNDLLRVLGKTQTDVEPGIRTNTCILLSRLSRHLQTSTQRKVLIPAFARAIRDPFVHARIAGLMALMATCEVFEKEDLAGKVIPAMSICLVDREKCVSFGETKVPGRQPCLIFSFALSRRRRAAEPFAIKLIEPSICLSRSARPSLPAWCVPLFFTEKKLVWQILTTFRARACTCSPILSFPIRQRDNLPPCRRRRRLSLVWRRTRPALLELWRDGPLQACPRR